MPDHRLTASGDEVFCTAGPECKICAAAEDELDAAVNCPLCGNIMDLEGWCDDCAEPYQLKEAA